MRSPIGQRRKEDLKQNTSSRWCIKVFDICNSMRSMHSERPRPCKICTKEGRYYMLMAQGMDRKTKTVLCVSCADDLRDAAFLAATMYNAVDLGRLELYPNMPEKLAKAWMETKEGMVGYEPHNTGRQSTVSDPFDGSEIRAQEDGDCPTGYSDPSDFVW